MNKLSIALTVAIIILSGFIAFKMYSGTNTELPTVPPQISTSTTPTTLPTSVTSKDIIEIKEIVIENTETDFSGLQLGETYTYDSYAFQVWFDENVGGEALLRKDGDNWVLVSLGGGAWEDYTLIELGVPENVATEMVKNRPY